MPGGVDPLVKSMPKMTPKMEQYLIKNYFRKTRGQMAEELGLIRFHLNMMTIQLKEQGKIYDR
ncbi:crp/Fnr family transcriptional regulator [Desmospora sp. 8437]|nr:crp/Fnr family transcriptional regulator [Desmospora sp. 8437]